MIKAMISRLISNHYQVVDENGKFYEASIYGKMRLSDKLKAGDFVEIELNQDKYYIKKVYPRSSDLIRPKIANVDQVMIIVPIKEPDFAENLLNYFIWMMETKQLSLCICLSKWDLASQEDEKYQLVYQQFYPTIKYSKYQNNRAEILSLLKNKITILCGNSGVGKSSLINFLDQNHQIKTQEISKALNRGKHTTRHYQLYYIDHAAIFDAPGFSAIDFKNIDLNYIARYSKFFDFLECQYNDCLHYQEPNCEVKTYYSQNKELNFIYQSYLKLYQIKKGVKK